METVPSISVFHAEEALRFYEKVFDAKIEQVIYMREAPMYKDSKYKDLVMHSRLMIGDSVFYLNDQLDNHIQEIGRNVQFCLNVFTDEAFQELYNNVKGRCEFEREITEEYWGAKSFSIKDPYGLIWHIFQVYETNE